MGKVLPTHSIRTFRYKPLVALDDSSWWIDCLLLLMVFVYAAAELFDIWLWFRRVRPNDPPLCPRTFVSKCRLGTGGETAGRRACARPW
eukprot:COSAG04_NODE_720_length_10812_cov_2.903108_11_plen_89_part_00